ncbi:MAG: hypothetical protein VX988_11325 [Planctomycetota bacterium]|nr:hypothetical protein [Planctomycetota bacterium]
MDWFQGLIPVIVIIFWVLSQVMGGNKAKQQQGKAAPPKIDGGVRGEIDSFLRQIKEQAGRPQEIDDDKDIESQPQAMEAEPVEQQVMEAELVEQQGIGRLISTIDERFDARSENLGAEVGFADDKMDLHVHQVFDHDVGKLHHSKNKLSGDEEAVPAQSGPEVSKAASDIRDMLSGASGVRKAVIMSEIINRPGDRW